MNPTISVITCTRNSSLYLGQLLESVRKQTLTPLEHVFVDGESEDETLAVINEYSETVDYEVVLVSSLPLGISNAMNIGTQYAKGEFILHLHSDDLFFNENSLEVITNALNTGKTNWLSGGCEYINFEGKSIGKAPEIFFSRKRLLKSNFISHPSTLIRADLLHKAGGFDESLQYAMDYDLWLRLSLSESLLTVPELISKFRVHSQGSSSANRKKTRQEDLFVRLRYTEGKLMILKAYAVYFLVNFVSKHPTVQKNYLKVKNFLSLRNK